MSKTVDVAKLAKLTNIPVTPEEVEKFESQFTQTLKTVALLEELDTKNVKDTPQVISLQNIFREDQIDTTRMFTQDQALQNAPKTYRGYILVPAIFNES